MNIEQLKQELSTVDLISEYPFINGYGISTKTNKETLKDEYVVEFYVSRKISLDYISENYVLPKSLSAFGIDVPTKVSEGKSFSIDYAISEGEEIKYYELIGDNLSACDDYNVLSEDYNIYLDHINSGGTPISGLSADLFYSYHRLNSDFDPIKRNYQKARPLSGGCSSIYYQQPHLRDSDATLGLLVRDKQDKKIVALSNAHVFSRSLLVGEEAKRFGQLDNALVLSASQPGSYNQYFTSHLVDHIGTPKRSSKISTFIDNKVDACILELSSYDGFLGPGSKNVIWFTQRGPYDFATTEEIDSIVDPDSDNYEAPIFRSGRTLGPLGMPGNEYPIKKTTGQSVTAIHSLTESLTTRSGVNLRTLGVSSLYINWNRYYNTSSMGALLFTDATETSAFAVGHTGWYYYTSQVGPPHDNLFFLKDHTNFDLDLAIVDPTGIKDIIIKNNNFGAFYLSKSNKVYYGHMPPCHGPGSLSFNINNVNLMQHYKDNPGFQDRKSEFTAIQNIQTDWIELSTVSGTFNKPVKKSYLSKDIGLLLTEDNQLWTMGGNLMLSADNDGVAQTRGNYVRTYINGSSDEFNDYVALSGSIGRFIQIPGEYIDFGFEYPYPATALRSPMTIYGLSATGGLLHVAYIKHDDVSISYKSFTDNPDINVSKPPQLHLSTDNWSISGSHDLSYSRLILSANDIKIKKIFTTSDKSGEIRIRQYTELPLQTEDNRILMIPHPYMHELLSRPTMRYLKYNNNDVYVDDNDPPKFLDNNILNNSGNKSGSTYGNFFLSGGSYYAAGMPNINSQSSYSFLKKLGAGTSYDIDSIYPMEDGSIKKWDNFPPNSFKNMVGEFGYSNYENNTNDNNYAGTDRSAALFVYTDGVGISALGNNTQINHLLTTGGTELLDEIRVSSVNSIINVRGFLPDPLQTLRFTDNLLFRNINSTGAAAAAGDSGSALFACLSSTSTTLSTFKCIGLLFAGADPALDSIGLGGRIDIIKDQLDIEPWDGVI
jgi:hypothetical protein